MLAAIEAVLVAKRVPEKQREAVMAAATENWRSACATVRRRRSRSTTRRHLRTAGGGARAEVQRTRERAAPVR